MPEILVGPLLGLESEMDYTVCLLCDATTQTVTIQCDGLEVPAAPVAQVPSGTFWRATFSLPMEDRGRSITYRVLIDAEVAGAPSGQSEWTFHIPGQDEVPVLAYASCNGFSSAELVTKTEEPYALWRKMKEMHGKKPFSLLIMGGDQLYADEIWGKVPELEKWAKLPKKVRLKRQPSKTMLAQVERFYDTLYRARWKQPAMAEMLASIPNVMMWDDHDIFDGWGSYPKDVHDCPVFQAIFAIAKKYFSLFQVRSLENRSLLSQDGEAFDFHFSFRGYHILALDNRSGRTLERVMTEPQWSRVIATMKDSIPSGDVLVLSAVPVVYRDFSLAETVMDITPWEEELTDDIKDHWRSMNHEGERARLIMNLLDYGGKNWTDGRTVILSGDVHLGCIGVVNDRRSENPRRVHQIVSSGIVHPSPSRIQWLGIMAATNDDTEFLNEEKSIDIGMLKPFGGDRYIRARNFVTLEKGTDNKLWVNWICDNGKRPHFPLT